MKHIEQLTSFRQFKVASNVFKVGQYLVNEDFRPRGFTPAGLWSRLLLKAAINAKEIYLRVLHVFSYR